MFDPIILSDWAELASFHEKSGLDDAANELGMVLHHVQALKSWQKGAIEGFFRKQNVKLIETIQGKTFRNILEKNKYNPEKESIITLSDFKRVLYKWLYDVYPFDEITIEHGKKVIPHKIWEKEIKNHPQDFGKNLGRKRPSFLHQL